MKKSTWIKNRERILEEYKARNNNCPQEYHFGLSTDYSAQLNFILDQDEFKSLQDLMLVVVDELFDKNLERYLHKEGLCDCERRDPGNNLKAFLRKIIEGK